MAVVLGIDAAWTASNPSGVALVRKTPAGWRTLGVAPSYEAFVELADGVPVDWTRGRFRGSAPPVKELLSAAESIAGTTSIDVVALDIPISIERITCRRAADNAISKAYGGRGCSTHSPNETRPGELGQQLVEQLASAGYRLATRVTELREPRCAIEVYPHPALLSLMSRKYRVPYKVGNSGKYWPHMNRADRITKLLEEFAAIETALSQVIGETGLLLPQGASSLKALKPYEDALDALVCAWVGSRFLDGAALAYGDDFSAVWVPPAE